MLSIRSESADISRISNVELIISEDIQDYVLDITTEKMEYFDDYLLVEYHIQFDASGITAELMKNAVYGDSASITMEDGSLIIEDIK
ncbi:MAG: hypothetical protein NC399_09255 [Muribaculum sp.]|nr:hypothetical protein [Muribaculum sp.]